jgi:hypothetical protein
MACALIRCFCPRVLLLVSFISCASFTSIVIFVDTFEQLFANLNFQKFPINNQTTPLLKAPPNFCYNYFFSDRLPPQDPTNVGNQTQGVLLSTIMSLMFV